MQEVNHKDYTEKAIDLISQGKALLTVKYEDKINIMTIGWGQIGHIWGKPIMTVLVRKSRYTHCLIDKADNFTVSLAFDGHDEIFDFCGTKSGRDYDKFKECNITTSPGKNVTSPIMKEFDLHFECKIVFKQDMNPNDLIDEYKNACYPSGDYHTIYYGQIMGCYIK